MSIYLLEKYSDEKGKIPDYGVAFTTVELLIAYANKQLGVTDVEAETINHALKIGWSLGLNDGGSYRVSLIPIVTDKEDATHNKFFKIDEIPNINDSQTELVVPNTPSPTNLYSHNKIEDNNIVMNFGEIIRKLPPKYITRNSFNKFPKDPYTRKAIEGSIKTRKVKLVHQTTDKK